ncbi:MAG: ABC transporter ATP-binding protein [Actinomycetota bacterium]
MATTDESDVDSKPEPDQIGLGELLAPVRNQLILACVFQAIGALAGIVPFIAVAEIGRELLGDRDSDRLWTIVIIAAVALAIRVGCFFAAAGITHFADNDFQLAIRRRIAEHLGRLPLGWFDDNDAGTVNKLIADDVSAMHPIVGHTFIDITNTVVTAIASIIYLFVIDWRMALVVLIPFVAGIFLYAKQMSGYGEKMEQYNQSMADVNTASIEFVQGIAVVKTFGQTGRAHKRYKTSTDSFIQSFWDWVKGLLNIASLSDIVLSPLTTLTLVLGASAWFIDRGTLEVADILVFLSLGLALTMPILTLGFAGNEVQLASAAAGRIGRALAEKPLPQPTDPQIPLEDDLRLEGVTFSYGPDEPVVLDDVSLAFEPDTVTAIVGASGSGKTTLGRLLCRFWDPTGGSIRLGGVDLRDIESEELYARVGFVFQNVQLIRGTIADNIRLADPEAPQSQVEAAAQAAQIHDRVMELPDGYESVIGENVSLSGGERQRLSIARALIANPPILVLDEATAFADPESEAAVQDALSTLVAGRTLIVIAHRLSTITQADQIVVLDEGRVVETGTHADLLDAGGTYQKQWAADARVTAEVG